MQILNSIKSLQSIRHDNDFACRQQKCAKIMKLMICICSEFYSRENFLTISLARVRLGRASAERLKPLGWTRTEYVKQGFLVVKGNWNKSNERKSLLSHFDTNVRKLYFWVKVSVPTVSTLSFWFSLKRLLNQQLCTTEGLGWCSIFCVSTVSFSPFVSFLLKYTIF